MNTCSGSRVVSVPQGSVRCLPLPLTGSLPPSLWALLLLEAGDGAQPKNPASVSLREGKDILLGSARHDVASVGCVTQVEGN